MQTRFAAIIALFLITTPAFTQIITEDLILTPPDPDKNIYFGSGVSLSDDMLAVCATRAECEPDRCGVVYLYDTTSFQVIHKFRPLRGSNETFYGNIQIKNDRIAINAYSAVGAQNVFSIYVYDMQSGDLLSHITNPDPDTPSETIFGYEFALGPDTLAVGDYLDNQFKGAAFLFNPDTGQLIEKLVPEDLRSYDAFGKNICFDNRRLVVTSHDRVSAPFNSGALHIYELNPGVEISRIPMHEELDYTRGLIHLTAESGNIILGNLDRRELRLLDSTNQQPPRTMVPQDSVSADDFFPASLAYAPPFAIAVGYFDSRVIHACLFDTSNGDQIARLGPSKSYFATLSPYALAMNDRFIVIGEPNQRTNGSWNVGAVYVYNLDSFVWSPTPPLALPLKSTHTSTATQRD